MEYTIHPHRIVAKRDPMIYGQFLEHFHRQIYGGVYEPESALSDDTGFRTDVIEALKNIHVPIVRWPGGCFVSSYHWYKGVGERVHSFDKAWRVDDPNTFGTDEFVTWCRRLGCEPYICTNAGTGTAEEMSDWMEYCNLPADQGEFSRIRAANGHTEPFNVKYWSIGNENYGAWEIGAKDSHEWSRLVTESAKMLQHVDPTAELSAAALTDIDWNVSLLKLAGPYLNWISIHAYWDPLFHEDKPASYVKCMSYTRDLEAPVRKVRGLLAAMGYEKSIRIAFDEWNLRGWHHPNAHTIYQGRTPEEYLIPRNRNDINATYTMADAVFTACVLNMFLRNADIVGMANYSPVVNTRGLVYVHKDGIVKRSTYYVFELYTHDLFDEVLDLYCERANTMVAEDVEIETIDCVATRDSASKTIGVSLVNKHPSQTCEIVLHIPHYTAVKMRTVNGKDPDDYNDVDREPITIRENASYFQTDSGELRITLEPHSVNMITLLPSCKD